MTKNGYSLQSHRCSTLPPDSACATADSLYRKKGLFADTLADAEGWRRRDDTPWSWAALAYVFGRSGDRAKAKLALEQLERFDRHHAADPISFAVA